MLDTIWGLVIVYLLIDIPFVVWMMGINFKMVPIEIDESARLDGCGLIRLLVRILLPITGPGIASAAISCIIAIWNEFLFAMVLTQTQAKTAPVVIMNYLSTSGMRWGEMAAVAMVLIIPPAIFGICIQKSYIRGLTAGSVKM
jgi:multiple sugar transport system permease protein